MRLWADAPNSTVPAAPSQLLFITIGVADTSRSFLDLTLREYCAMEEALRSALVDAEKVMIGVTTSGITISAEGADANALWDLCSPVLTSPAIRGGVAVLRRYGGPGAREIVTYG